MEVDEDGGGGGVEASAVFSRLTMDVWCKRGIGSLPGSTKL